MVSDVNFIHFINFSEDSLLYDITPLSGLGCAMIQIQKRQYGVEVYVVVVRYMKK